MKSSWWLAALVALFAVLQVARAAVMSIDYGTEWFKVGLIKPGIPLDVALNKDSKRKTQAIVTLRGDERLYGSDAVALASRFPHLTYSNLKSIVGKPFDDKHSIEYRKRFVNRMIADPNRNAPLFLHDENRTLTVEELIAYQFQNAREQAKHAAGEDVKDAVITVAPYMTQYERQAILDAAELAGLNVLTLIHDETAVALNYAISREFSATPENHIFYDMGAGSTVAAIVSFSNVEVKEGKRTHNVPQLEVKAIGFDRTLGGHEFDVRLQNFLADKFTEQHSSAGDIRSSESAMSRLLKEANRVKQILSANTETMASIESLYNDIDFKTEVTRADLETLCKDLLDRVPGPIESALQASGMEVDDIKSLVLVGGGVRVPAIQKSLAQIVGAQKIAKNVNGDEAAVLGAAFRGASLSNQFRLTKEIKIKDITVFPIEVTYRPENSEGDDLHVTLFNESGTIGMRKIMSFKKATDFEFDVKYGKIFDEQDKVLGLDKIAKVKVTGLSAAMAKHQEDIKAAEQPPKVRVAIELSNSGILSVPEATLSFQTKEAEKESFSDKVKSFFGSKDESENDKEEMEKNGKNTTEEAGQTAPEGEEAKPKAKETTVKKIPLEVEFIPTGPLPMSSEEKAAARLRIQELDRLDEKRRLREESRNNLESFVYRVQEYLYDDDILAVSTEEQQDELRKRLSETSDWLYDEGENADTPEYLERLRSLQLLERPITFRRYEYTRRSENINKMDNSIKMARNFVETIRLKTPEEERYHTDEELDGLLEHASRLENWRNDKVAAQEKLANHVDPVLTTSEVKQKCEELDAALLKLMQKKKPKASKKVEKNATEADTTPKEDQEQPGHDEL